MAAPYAKSQLLQWFRPSRFVLLAAGLFIVGVVFLVTIFDREAASRNTQNQLRNALQLTKMLQQEVNDELRASNNLIALIEAQLATPAGRVSLSAFIDSHIRLVPDVERVTVTDASGKILVQSRQANAVSKLPRPSAPPLSMAEIALFTAISKASSAPRLVSVGFSNNSNNVGLQIAARASAGTQPTTPPPLIFLHLSAQHFEGLLNSITAIKDGAVLHAALLHTDGRVITASRNALITPMRSSANRGDAQNGTRLVATTWLAQAVKREFAALDPVSLSNVEAPVFEAQPLDTPTSLTQTESPEQTKASAGRLLAHLSYAQLREWPLAVVVWAEPTPTLSAGPVSFATQTVQRLHAAAAALCLIIFLCALGAARALKQREVSQLALRESQMTLRVLSDDLAQAQRIGRFGRWHWNLRTDIVTFSDDYAEFMQVETGPAPQKMRDWIAKITHPDEIDVALANYENRLFAEPFGRERRVVSKHGETRWCYTAGEPVFDAAGHHIAYRGITRDITDTKNAETKQQQLSQELEDAQTIAQMGHFTWLLADDSISGSQSFANLYDITMDTRPATARELIEEFTEGQQKLNAIATYAKRFEGNAFRVDRQIITRKKNRKWIETIATPFFDTKGALVGYRGVQRDISATKEAAVAIAQSEERYRLISDNMLDIVCLHDADATVRYVSPSIFRLLGYSPDASIGVRFSDLVHAEDLLAVLTAQNKLHALDVPRSQVECRFRARDGHYIWLESIVAKLPDNNYFSQEPLFLVVARDATQRKQAEAAVQASEARFRQLTQLSADWYWETDAQGRFTFFSRPHPIIHNLPSSKILGQLPHIIFPDQLNAVQLAEYAQLVQLRQPFRNIAITARDARGAVIAHAITNGEPYFNADGSYAGYRGTGRDVSAEKFALIALKTSSQRFESLTRLSADWYWEQDVNYRFTFYSHPIIVGSDAPSTIFYGKTRWELYPEALTPAQWTQHRAQLDARLPFYDLVLTIQAQNESDDFPMDRYFAASGAPIFDDHGVFMGYRGTGRDLTIAKRAEVALALHAVQLERANKLLDTEATRRMELERNTLISIEMELAQVGLELHDQLGQDLTGISFLIKMLEKRLGDMRPEDAQQAAKIGALVTQAIKHTRMISHGLSPYIWGADGLNSAITQLSNDINMIGVAQCSATLDANIVIADDLVARSFYRIAQEATNNALKHGKATQIEISLSQTDDVIALEICDNGFGVARATADAPTSASPFPNKPGYSYSIQHRASLIGATVTVNDNSGAGTVVTVLLMQDNLGAKA